MPTTFIPNPHFEAELRASIGVYRMLQGMGPQLEDESRSRARHRKGFLEKGINYQVGLEDGGFVGRLNSHDFKSAWYEFGSARTPADAFLRSTVEDLVGPVTGGDK